MERRPEERRTVGFVLWLETHPGHGRLRGEVEHVPSGERRRCESLSELVAFLRAATHDPKAVADPDDGR